MDPIALFVRCLIPVGLLVALLAWPAARPIGGDTHRQANWRWLTIGIGLLAGLLLLPGEGWPDFSLPLSSPDFLLAIVPMAMALHAWAWFRGRRDVVYVIAAAALIALVVAGLKRWEAIAEANEFRSADAQMIAAPWQYAAALAIAVSWWAGNELLADRPHGTLQGIWHLLTVTLLPILFITTYQAGNGFAAAILPAAVTAAIIGRWLGGPALFPAPPIILALPVALLLAQGWLTWTDQVFSPLIIGIAAAPWPLALCSRIGGERFAVRVIGLIISLALMASAVGWAVTDYLAPPEDTGTTTDEADAWGAGS